MSESQESHDFAAYLRGERKRKRLKQQELADLLHIARGTIVEWESGRQVPTPANRRSIEATLEAYEPPVVAALDDGAIVGIPRDLAMFWLGKLDSDARTLAGIGQSLDAVTESVRALQTLLAQSAGSVAGFVASGVLPQPTMTLDDVRASVERLRQRKQQEAQQRDDDQQPRAG